MDTKTVDEIYTGIYKAFVEEVLEALEVTNSLSETQSKEVVIDTGFIKSFSEHPEFYNSDSPYDIAKELYQTYKEIKEHNSCFKKRENK